MEEVDYVRRTKELKSHLVRRGYREDEVQSQIDRATSVRGTDAPSLTKGASTRIPLVATYHPDRPNLSRILRIHLPILHVSHRMKEIVPDPPLVANR